MFSGVWLLVGWMWLNAFPKVFGPLNPAGQMAYLQTGSTFVRVSGFGIACSTLPCPPPLEGAQSLLKLPLLSLLFLGLLLGASSGGAWQLWPGLASRILAFVGAIVSLLWIGSRLFAMPKLPALRTLFWGMDTPQFAWGWLHILPFVVPFLCAVGLLGFAAFSRSRPLA